MSRGFGWHCDVRGWKCVIRPVLELCSTNMDYIARSTGRGEQTFSRLTLVLLLFFSRFSASSSVFLLFFLSFRSFICGTATKNLVWQIKLCWSALIRMGIYPVLSLLFLAVSEFAVNLPEFVSLFCCCCCSFDALAGRSEWIKVVELLEWRLLGRGLWSKFLSNNTERNSIGHLLWRNNSFSCTKSGIKFVH